jgi:hypothetical protein
MDRDLIEGVDYYFENGLMVFTEYYLRERGYCCTNGCRHCPYGFRPAEAMIHHGDTEDTENS